MTAGGSIPSEGAGERTAVAHIEVTDSEEGVRLDRWFRRRFPKIPHAHLEKWLRSGEIRVDGGRAKAGDRLSPGQIVRVPPHSAEGNGALPDRRVIGLDTAEAASLHRQVLYRDDEMLVINKPPGLAVQGGSGLHRHLDAMLDALRFGGERPRLVHRLDRDTSGVLVLARTVASAASLAKAFRNHTIRKLYWALVIGVPAEPAGRIDLALAKLPGPKGERVSVVDEGGDRAITEYRTIESIGSRFAWLALEPETGRTHQLRAHCEALGLPILGDRKYGDGEVNRELSGGGEGLHLHARAIVVPRGDSGKPLIVVAPLPPHMARTWRFLGLGPETGVASVEAWLSISGPGKASSRQRPAAMRRPSSRGNRQGPPTT